MGLSKPPTHEQTLYLPDHATASAFSVNGTYLAVGSDDGTVRIYGPPEQKVRKAIRALGSSVSSICLGDIRSGPFGDEMDLWVAAGRTLFQFLVQFDARPLVYARSDARLAIDVGRDEDDSINGIALSARAAYVACTTDAGSVFVLDTATALRATGGSVNSALMRMKAHHTSIAYIAAFVPHRPAELVTGGYDCSLLLFDARLGALLARLELSPAPSLAPGISSLPPFITALAISPRGALTIGTADGRIWVGLGGEHAGTTSEYDEIEGDEMEAERHKNESVGDPDPQEKRSKARALGKKPEKRKRSRKWGAFQAEYGFYEKVAEEMITGLHFISPDRLVSSTVHGRIAAHQLVRRPPSSMSGNGLRELWKEHTRSCAKLNTLSGASRSSPGSERPKEIYLAFSGLHEDTKRGVAEMWRFRG